MKRSRKFGIVLLTLIAVGFAKRPFEESVANDLRERRLLLAPIDFSTRQALGQTSTAIALGGMRSLIASLLYIQSETHFEHQEWAKLEKKYQNITTLQPHNYYYWDTGFWHLAYNAYADYGDRPDIPEARRRYLQKQFLARGKQFLIDGIANNPDDWRLRRSLARVLTDPFKPKDFPAAVAVLDEALERGPIPAYLHRERFYALGRIPDRADEAWVTAQELWKEPSARGTPSVRLLYFTLQHRFVARKDHIPLEILFGRHNEGEEPKARGRQRALKYLSFYWLRKREGFPMDGVREAIELLLKEFQIPPKHSPFNPMGWKGYPPQLFKSSP